MELGLVTFADVAPGGDVQQRFKDLLEEIELADRLGLDVFGIGEHHRPDYAVSAPTVTLAAAAARTDRIRLSSAVTVLSSADPVRVFEEFATVDNLSGGRAEIMAGRGSFIESFPLFGYDLDDYDELYAEHLDLLLKLRDSNGRPVSWQGKHRAPLSNVVLHPRPVQAELPVWIAVGGSPESVVRAGMLGLPLTVAIIGGQPERFKPLVDLYRRAGAEAGHAPERLKVGINTHAFLADTADEAANTLWPHYQRMMARIGRERGWPPMQRPQFDHGRKLDGAYAVDDPRQMVERILLHHDLFGHDRYLAHMSLGTVPHEAVLHAIELFATEVAPAVRERLAERAATATAARA